jgi:hypothetical protein
MYIYNLVAKQFVLNFTILFPFYLFEIFNDVTHQVVRKRTWNLELIFSSLTVACPTTHKSVSYELSQNDWLVTNTASQLSEYSG